MTAWRQIPGKYLVVVDVSWLPFDKSYLYAPVSTGLTLNGLWDTTKFREMKAVFLSHIGEPLRWSRPCQIICCHEMRTSKEDTLTFGCSNGFHSRGHDVILLFSVLQACHRVHWGHGHHHHKKLTVNYVAFTQCWWNGKNRNEAPCYSDLGSCIIPRWLTIIAIIAYYVVTHDSGLQ